MSQYALADRAELAFKTYLDPILGLSVQLGKNNDIKDLPSVTVACEKGEEETKGTGNFWVDARLFVRYKVNKDPEQEAQTIYTVKDDAVEFLSKVNNAVFVGDIEAQLTASASEFHVFATSLDPQPEDRNELPESNAWEDILHVRFLACGTDIT